MTDGKPVTALELVEVRVPSGQDAGQGAVATGGGATAPHVAGSSGFLRRAAIPGMLVVATALWAALYRYWMVQGDDFRFTGFHGEPHASFRSTQWWALLRYDYLRRTGRTSDSIGRLLLRPGHWFFPGVAVAVVVLLGWAAVRWLETGRVRSIRTVAIGATLLPMTLLCRPALNGDAVYWEMSFVNYVLPGLGAVFALGTLARTLSGRRVGLGTFLLAMLVGMFTGTTHEVFAVGFVAVVLLTLLGGRRLLGMRALLLLVSLAIGAVVLLAAPGFWVRVGQNSGTAASGEDGMVLRAHKLMMGSVHEFEVARWQLCVGALAVSLLAWRSGGARRRAGAAMLVLLTVALPALAWRWVHVTAPLDGLEQRITAPELAVGGVFVGALVAVLLLMLWLTAPRRGVLPHGSWPAFIALAMAAGASVPSSMSGVGTPRAYLPAALFLMLVALDVVLELCAGRRLLASLLAIGLLIGCVAWWAASFVAMRDNHARMQPVLRQFELGPAAPRQIEVPMTLPHPDWQYQKGFDLQIYRKYIIYWYGMPVDTRLVQVPS